MPDFIKAYFTFSKGDRNAFVILFLLLIGIVLAPYAYLLFFEKEDTYDYSSFRNEVLAFELSQKPKSTPTDLHRDTAAFTFNYDNIDGSMQKSKLNPFPFNPNNLSSDEWRRMGMSERQIRGIKNFEAKGGRFLVKSDLKKLFVISDDEYELLSPYIQLPDNRPERRQRNFSAQDYPAVALIEINTADTLALKSLRGIGSRLSGRIVSYRQGLGGFLEKDQLLEVYGIDSALYGSIAPYIVVNPALIEKININTAEYDALVKHPYISRNVALSVVNMRKMHGAYTSVADILRSELIDDDLFYKISPYLTIGTP